MPSQEKKDKVKQIRKWFSESDELLVLHYKGLKVSEANELRVKLSEMDAEMRVLKNTLTRIALADSPSEGIMPLLDGPVAVVFVKNDPATVAKAVRDFAKGRKEFYLQGGLLEGRVLDGKQVESFAMLPPREVLLAQMAGMIQAPLARMVGTVVAPARKMLGLFQALADKKVAESPAPAPVEVVAEAPAAAEAPAEPSAVEDTTAADTAEPAVSADAAAEVTEEAAAPEEAEVTEEAPAPEPEAEVEAIQEADAGDTGEEA